MKKIPFLLFLIPALTCCTSDDNVRWQGGANIDTIDAIDFTTAEESANEAVNKFSFDAFNSASRFYKSSFADSVSGNMTVSPLSLAINVALRACSFDKETEETTLRAFGLNDIETLRKVCNKLMRFIPSPANGGKIVLANSVWYNDSYEVSPSYINMINTDFYADVVGFDAADPKQVQSSIDGWCSENTKGMIDYFPVNITPEIVAVMLNAMYFTNQWLFPFDSKKTQEADFNGTHGSKKCLMMSKKFYGQLYYSNEVAEASILPYKGCNRMIIILPKDGVSIEELSQSLNYRAYKELLADKEVVDLDLHFPKFEGGSEMKMNSILSEMGIRTSDIVPQKMGLSKSTNSQIKQITKIILDEEGTQAAAVTGDEIDEFNPHRGVSMRFDRPFLYFIENTVTGTILLAGRICNL